MSKKEEFHTNRGYQIIRNEEKELTSSMEDYMEMIYKTCLNEGYIRMNDLALLLNVQASSASKVVQKLTNLGLLNYEKYGIIQLTEKGKEVGGYLLQRHKTIETFLKNLLTEENLLIDTEMIEHYISKETLNNIDMFNKFLDDNPQIRQNFASFQKRKKKDPTKY